MIDAGPLPDPFAWHDGRRGASPAAWPYAGREHEFRFDQHCLAASISPRQRW